MKDRRFSKFFLTILLACFFAFSCSGCKESNGGETIRLEEFGENTENFKKSAAKEEPAGEEPVEKETPVVVYVCGAVNNPGVYTLKENSRVYEAVKAAGGIKSDGCGEALNQARILADGEKIYIPTQKEIEEQAISGVGQDISGANDPEKVNINKADKDELMTLPGIGESKAESIILFREKNGGFKSIEELKNINGIKEGVYNKIKDKITA